MAQPSNVFKEVLRDDQIKTDSQDLEIYAKDWTKHLPVRASCALFPETEEQVQKIVLTARKHQLPLVPSGGRTGLSGGAVASHGETVVSMERMNKILDFSEADQLVTTEAGVVTKEIQTLATERGFYFPIDFASAGSSQIGGNLATNAGGVHVLRYGNIRQWVAGMRVVTGSGEILQLDNSLVKDATGYDLKQLFIGSEGTLGFITQANLKVTKLPKNKTVLLLGLESWQKALELFSLAKKEISLSAFEIFTDLALSHVLEKMELTAPLEKRHPLYLLIESEQAESELSEFIDKCFGESLCLDGTMSQSSAQFEQLWGYRENISEAISTHQPYKNDISVRSSLIPAFVQKAQKLLVEAYPDFEVVWFGHVGDGNLHVNILKPTGVSSEDFVKKCKAVDELLFKLISEFRGSISAEHGVGLVKKQLLHYSRTPVELEYMRQLKRVFDPDAILNPGKIFDL